MKKKYSIKKDNFEIEISKDKLFKSLDKIISNGVFLNGKTVEEFEKSFSSYVNCRYCIGFSSASTGFSSLVNIITENSKNSEIIIPAYAPIPVSVPILNYNKKIVFCDVDKNTFLMCENDLHNKVTKKTKVILPVHLFGNVFNIAKLIKQLKKENIHIIEDSSQAHGSSYDGLKAGSQGYASVFSFYPTKNIGAFGDAGSITTNNKSLAFKLMEYRNYGLNKNKNRLSHYGNNFRMDEIQALIINFKLEKIEKWNTHRNIIANAYIKNLLDLPIQFQDVKANVFSCYHVFSIVVPKKIRNKLFYYLQCKGIQVSKYYNETLPMISGFLNTHQKVKANFPNSYYLSQRNLSLPINHKISIKEVEKICSLIRKFFR